MAQILVVVLYSISIGVAISLHGKPKTGSHNVVMTLVATGIVVGLLWWGGFWDVWLR